MHVLRIVVFDILSLIHDRIQTGITCEGELDILLIHFFRFALTCVVVFHVTVTSIEVHP